VFYLPDFLGHPDNYIPANPLKTPAHIVPEWYFLPFYAILRAITFNIGIPFTDIVLIDSKLGGVIAMFGSIAILFVLPWLDRSPVRSANYRPLYRQFFWIFVVVCIALGYLGSRPAEGIYTTLSQIFTFYYFAHFLIILPWLSKVEKPKALPSSIAEAVLGDRKKTAVQPAE
jgi:ubiquinol-cytochrome c reductase cytochrome b subunit